MTKEKSLDERIHELERQLENMSTAVWRYLFGISSEKLRSTIDLSMP